MQARRIARELALLSISQLPANQEKLAAQQLQNVMLAAVRTLTTEAQETLETAAAELKRGSDRLLNSETRAIDLQSARVMVNDAIELTQTAINRLGGAVELPEFIQLTNQQEVRAYAMELISMVNAHRTEVNQLLTQVLVDWQLARLARIDQDILRIAVVEILFLGVPDRVAINEAVELAKRYSGEEGHRFVNGVLRRVTDQLKTNQLKTESPST
jgi:N utilization substance protein B